jgi:hypothetical protein
MACNLNDDFTGWYGHVWHNSIKETPSPMGDAWRGAACVSTGTVREARDHTDELLQ